MKSKYTRTGVRRAGDDYQDIIALVLLVEWLEHPERYLWARVEADDAGFLDDFVALRADNVVVATQVKFSAHPDDSADPYSWDDLLKQRSSTRGERLPSLLSKWSTSFQDLKIAYGSVEARLVSNRRPADDLRSSFGDPGIVDLQRIPDPSVRSSIVAQLGGEQNAYDFLGAFKFELDQPGLDTLEAAVAHRFLNLHGDVRGWKSLKDALRKWVRERHSPSPDGQITFMAVKNAAEWQRLEALPEEFAVPIDFVIPDSQFHRYLWQTLTSASSNCVVLTGPPGIGKSTYISNLYQELREAGLQVIRHHYFLSPDDRSPFRYDHVKVAGSLMSEMRTIYTELGLIPPGGNPRPEDLSSWLADCGQKVLELGGHLVIILDGLDHVWSDAGSIEELNKLFQLVTPVPPGTILLIGTQPVDNSRLPRRLCEIAPRESWLDLPVMDYSAVRYWAEIHASELRAIRNAMPDPQVLSGLAGALWRRSEGYPLHLRYLLKSLETVKGYIIERDIELLPELSHRDIGAYYARFWEDLPDESKQVLSLLATCDFPWSRTAIAECLDPAHRNLTIHGAIRRVTHLTSEGPLGLQLAHSSLAFFVRQHRDYENYGMRIRELALEWLRTKAPDVLRWSYEWLLAADIGDEAFLMRAPNREWLIESMARRYPVHIANRILTRSARIALDRGQLDRFVELGLLSDYLAEAMDSRDYVVQPLLAPQLAITEDPTLLNRCLTELNGFGNQELVCLAEACERAEKTTAIRDCFDKINSRLEMGESRRHDAYPQMNTARCLARIAAIAPDVDPGRMVGWLQRQSDRKFGKALWGDYTGSLRAHRQAERLRIMIRRTEKLPEQKVRALSQLVLLACEDGIDVGVSGHECDDPMDPFVLIRKILRRESANLDVPIVTPDPWFLRLNEYEFYQHYDQMAEYFWRIFFVFTANCLCEREDDCARLTEPFQGKGWIAQFVECCVSAASMLAQHFNSGEFVRYSWIFAQFSKVDAPDFMLDRTAHSFAITARQAIFRIAIDLQALQSIIHPPRIDAEDINIIPRMPLFVLSLWLEIAAACGRAWCTSDGLASTLMMIESHLGVSIEDFGSRAELCGLAARLAALHGDRRSTERWVRNCWSNLVAYGYHKDMLLDQCLDAAKHLKTAGWNGDALDLCTRLAPAIAAVGDYTDGDETNHLPAKLGDFLFASDFQRFVSYHEWLSNTGEYWDARSIFETFVEEADLGNRIFRAVAETAVEWQSISALSKRSHHGDANAVECLNRMAFFQVPREEKATLSPERSDLTETGPLPKPADFPPESFEAYIGVLNSARNYRVDEHVDEWGRFWAAHAEKQAVFDVLEEYDQGRQFLSGDYKLRFDLTLEVKGKNTAYDKLVTAQGRRYGWTRYFARSEDIYYLWKKLKEIYPERWMSFLQSTLMSDSGSNIRSAVSVQGNISRLVELLLFVEQPSIGKAVARAATDATLQLLPVKLPAATWIPKGTL